jgi:hypothetical protein
MGRDVSARIGFGDQCGTASDGPYIANCNLREKAGRNLEDFLGGGNEWWACASELAGPTLHLGRPEARPTGKSA